MTTISSLLLTILIGARVQRLPTVAGNGHGLLCSSLFNDRYTQTPQSYVIVANLTEGVLDSCAIQAYSEASFDAYVALGHGIDGYAGYPVTGTGLNPTCTGFNATVIGPQGGLTAGDCAYSYPGTTNSTCRIKTNATHELQWCQNDLNTSLRLGRTIIMADYASAASPSSPYNNPICDEEVVYHDSFALDEFPTVAVKEQYLYPRYKLYGSTRLNICEKTMDEINARGRADHHASSSRPDHPTITTGAIVLAVIGVMVSGLMFS